MDNNDTKYSEVLVVFLCFILALLGGTAKELSKLEEQFIWRRFFANVFIAGIAGLFVGLLAPDFEHKNWIMFASGLAGWSGISFMNFCADVLKTVITKSVKVDVDEIDKKRGN